MVPPVSDGRNIKNIALVGFMGTGKSTVGRQLAADLQFRFIDTDELIEEQAGMKISEIFTTAGEPMFRQLEGRLVDELADWENTVISTGGGLIVHPGNLEKLKRHALVVCLWAGPQAIYQRTAHQTHRPLLQGPEPLKRIEELLALREPFYRQADLLVSTELRSVRELATNIAHQFRLAGNNLSDL